MNQRLRFITIVAAFLALTSSASWGQSGVMTGAGALTCDQYLYTRTRGSPGIDALSVSWIQGFLSAINTERSRAKQPTQAIPEADVLLSYVDKFCAANMSQRPADAMLPLHRDLGAYRR